MLGKVGAVLFLSTLLSEDIGSPHHREAIQLCSRPSELSDLAAGVAANIAMCSDGREGMQDTLSFEAGEEDAAVHETKLKQI